MSKKEFLKVFHKDGISPNDYVRMSEIQKKLWSKYKILKTKFPHLKIFQ